jgi:hypothetical protein
MTNVIVLRILAGVFAILIAASFSPHMIRYTVRVWDAAPLDAVTRVPVLEWWPRG